MRDAGLERNRTIPSERRLALPIGVNLGDIVFEDGDIFGDGVNITARIEALAEPGSIYISAIVHDQVADKLDFDFEDLGPNPQKHQTTDPRLSDGR